MTKPNTPHKIVVVLKLPRKVADFIVLAGTIHDSIQANITQFPALPVPLTTLASSTAALQAAENAAQLRTKGAVATRDAARKTVVDDLNQTRGYVETLVNATPANAAILAQDAGMSLRKITTHPKSDLAVKQVSSGVVKVIAKATTGAKAYDWQYSTDGGKTWTSVPTTTKASTTITGLPPGTSVSYRHRPITKAGPQDWGQDISAIVV